MKYSDSGSSPHRVDRFSSKFFFKSDESSISSKNLDNFSAWLDFFYDYKKKKVSCSDLTKYRNFPTHDSDFFSNFFFLYLLKSLEKVLKKYLKNFSVRFDVGWPRDIIRNIFCFSCFLFYFISSISSLQWRDEKKSENKSFRDVRVFEVLPCLLTRSANSKAKQIY